MRKAKVFAIFIILILTSCSFQTNFLNLQPNQHTNNIEQTFVQTASATTSISQIENYVMFGFNSVRIEANTVVTSGNVGSQNAATTAYVEGGATMTNPNSALVGDSVIIEKKANVNNAYYNSLTNLGTIHGNKITPLTLPVVSALPTFPQFAVGFTNVKVESGTMVLNSGSYGNVTLGDSSTLELVGGTYNINSLKIGKNSNLLFDATSQVNVGGRINTDSGGTIGPSNSASIDAKGITFFVTSDVNTGISSTIKANIFSKGDIRIGERSTAIGAFIGNTVRVEQKSTITLNSGFTGVGIQELLTKYQGITAELGNISNVSDEATVTDYLNQSLNSLEANTTSLVSDSTTRSNLISILSSAMQNVVNAGNAVLSLDDTGANSHLNATGDAISNYITQVKSFNGTTIPTSVANTLVADASSVSSNSTKRGVVAAELTDNTQLIITNKIITKTRLDLTSLNQTVISIEGLGFKVNATAQGTNPLVGHVLFFNPSDTSQQFDFIIQPNTLSVFAAMGMSDEMASFGTTLSNQQVAVLLLWSPVIVNGLTHFSNASLGNDFVVDSLTHFHFNANKDPVILLIMIAVETCLEIPECEVAIETGIHIGVDAGQQVLEKFLYPLVTIDGIKFEDLNGSHSPTGQPALASWNFTMFTNNSIEPLAYAQSGSDGTFHFYQVKVFRAAQSIVIAETTDTNQLLNRGWSSTTGQVQTIPFQIPPFGGVFEPAVVQFGNVPTQSPGVFLNDQFTSSLEGWIAPFGYPGYPPSLDSSTGQPPPSAHLSGDAWFGICSPHGMYKQVDISSYTGGPLTLAFNWRASSALDYVTTNANVEVDDASNGTPLFSERLLPDSGFDTSWQYYSKDISSYVSGKSRIQVDLYLYDCWEANWNQNNWYDDVSIFTGTTPPAGVVLNTHP